VSLHLWHNLSPGPDPPTVIHAVIEVPKGSRNKYEYDKQAGVIKLDRVLYSPLHYPGDYGFIPQTYFDDGDPLDILVIMNEATFPGCVVEARPVAMFQMIDDHQPDSKILAVPATDPHFADYHDLDDLPHHLPIEIEHFFTTYKQLQGVTVQSDGWVNAYAARQTILQSLERYRATFSSDVPMTPTQERKHHSP
jgi:inorganic pyrophosphatase